MQRSTSFGQLVRQRRKALDLTQADLAAHVGCAEVTIRKLEADTLRPSRHFLLRLAKQLGIDPANQAAFVAHGRNHNESNEPSANHDLPIPPNPLIGRDHERTAAQKYLTNGVRLLTLTGPGGVGKTRLALQIAHDCAVQFADGVVFVSLAAFVDADRIDSAIAQALALDAAGVVSPTQQIIEHLRAMTVLLVLDNVEHVVAGAPLVATLLVQCPKLRVLATSRVPLHLSGEHELAVPPLAVPHDPAITVADLDAVPAIALFVARARAVRSTFELTSTNAAAVAEICTRLDGLPLAIELAAAWIKMLPPDALLERLRSVQPLHMLVGGARDLPMRHQTLRTTIAWSYDLLDAQAQAVFRRLSVCAGGCTFAAAETLVRDCVPDHASTLTALAALVDGSLLRQEVDASGTMRVLLLETIHDYALERLTAAGELPAAQQHHAAIYLALAEAARPHVQSQHERVWLDRLAADYDNLRAALTWSCAPDGDGLLGLRIAEAMWEFWLIRGSISEGRMWIARLLDLPAAHEPALTVAHLLNGAGRLAWAQNDWHAATVFLERSHALCTQLGDVAGSAQALNHLGEVAHAQGHYTQAAAYFAQSLALFEQLGDRDGSASALVSYSQILQAQGQPEQATAVIDRSMQIFAELGDQRGLAVALTVQGQVLHMRGEYQRADHYFAQSLVLFQRLGYRHGVGWALTNQGQTALAQHDYGRATHLFAESVALYRELGDQRGRAWAMVNQGLAAYEQGESARGRTLLHESIALFARLGDQRGYAWALYHAAHQLAAAESLPYVVESLRVFHALGDVAFCATCLAELATRCADQGHTALAEQFDAVAQQIREPHNADLAISPSEVIEQAVTAIHVQLHLPPFQLTGNIV